MKIGDLVQVLPGRVGFYIIVGRSKRDNCCWKLVGAGGGSTDGGEMNEEYIKVLSSSDL